VRVEVHELNADFFERSVAEQMSLYSGESFVWIIISLLNKTELITLGLVESRLYTVGLLEALETEDKQLRIILVIQRREWDVNELARLKPVYER
jgi:hypothetical protein